MSLIAAQRVKRVTEESVRMEKELIVYNEPASKVHVLNETAGYVWELCDGSLSVADIAERMVDAFAVDAASSSQDVHELVERLVDVGLVKYCTEEEP